MKDRIMKCMLSVMFSFALFFVSCSDNRSVKELGKIEALMQEDPVKVLETLENIDERTLKGDKAKALYALLYSQAKDKNWIDETDDSLISIAVNYFKESNDTYHKFLSYFYCGRVYQNAGNLAKAIISFTKAEEMVTDMCDFYYVGLLYANLGLLYQDINNYTKSLEAFENAFKYYSNAGKHHHSMYAKLNMGNILLNMKQYDKAEQCLEGVMEWSYKNNDSVTIRNGLVLLADLYEQTKNCEALKTLLSSRYYEVDDESCNLLQYKAYVYALEGKMELAQKFLCRAWSIAVSQKDSAVLYHREYSINKMKGEYDEALMSHEKLLYNLDRSIRVQLQQPVIAVQKDYYREEARLNQYQLKQNRNIFIVLSVAAAIIFVLVVVICVYKIRIGQKKIDWYMDKIGNLENLLLSVHSDRSIETKEMSEKISSLFISQFSLIDKLSTTYYETHGSNKDKDAIYRQVTKEIEKLSKDKKYLIQLESIVNKYKDNVMQITREVLPELSEMDLRILCYFFAGFSAKAISIFTNNSTGNIYVKKGRLKERISSLESAHKDIILRHMS